MDLCDASAQAVTLSTATRTQDNPPASHLWYAAARPAHPYPLLQVYLPESLTGVRLHISSHVQSHTVEEILLSQKKLAGIKVRIRAEFFGFEWAQSPEAQERYDGVIQAWGSKKDKTIRIRWDGWDAGKVNSIETLIGDDENGDAYEFELLSHEDGSPVVFVPPAPANAPAAAAARRRGGAAPADAQPAADDAEADEAEEADEADADADETEAPAEVEKAGIKWKKGKPSQINFDRRTHSRFKPSLNETSVDKNNIVELADLLLSDEWLADQAKWTNRGLHGDGVNAKTTKGELKQWWGYALALSLNPGKPVEQMWSLTPGVDDILPPPAMGRFGMTLDRWMKLRSAMRFGPDDTPDFESNLWCFVEKMVTDFNEHMAAVFTPGWLLSMDESMSAWRGKQGEKNISKIPNMSWVPRKPEPMGAELKTTACALSGMLIFVEICKGKKEHPKQKFFDKKLRPHTTATSLRLVENWFGSNRAVYGDSWFAGVKTATAFLKHGLHFVGDVKTNTAGFCKTELQDATTEERGAWAVYTADLDVDGTATPVYAVSHRRGPAVHAFISTFGTTLPGTAHYGTIEDDEDGSGTVQYELERKCPRILNDATLAQPATDRHNRYRQFILAMEKRILTGNFCLRFGTTMYGMLFTNAFFAKRCFGDKQANFKKEMNTLSLAWMRNPLRAAELAAINPQRTPSVAAARLASTCVGPDAEHILVRLKDIPGYKGCKQPRCNMCNKPTSWVCAACTKSHDLIFPIHPPTTRGGKGMPGQAWDCLAKHRLEPETAPRGTRKTKRVRPSPGEAEEADGDDMECSECEEEEQ